MCMCMCSTSFTCSVFHARGHSAPSKCIFLPIPSTEVTHDGVSHVSLAQFFIISRVRIIMHNDVMFTFLAALPDQSRERFAGDYAVNYVTLSREPIRGNESYQLLCLAICVMTRWVFNSFTRWRRLRDRCSATTARCSTIVIGVAW